MLQMLDEEKLKRHKLQQKKSGKQNRLSIGKNVVLTLSDAKRMASGLYSVRIHPNSFSDIHNTHAFLKAFIEKREPVYGINTQFGDQVNLVDNNIESDSKQYYDCINHRQKNIIRSLHCGMGNKVPPEIVRVTMFLRAHCLSQGYSGVAQETIETVVNVLNSGIVPIVFRYGSIGASGDLIPLSAIAAVLIGENIDVYYKGNIVKAPMAFKKSGLRPLNPEMRDGLALINGTSFMTAIASLSLYELKRLFHQMLYSIAMALESLKVISSAYHPLVHQLKKQSGQQKISHFMNEFWKGSQLLSNLDVLREQTKEAALVSHENIKPVQDYYSLRSVAQGFGPFQENLDRATEWVEHEMNSVNDNPIIDTKEKKIHHGANFMGYYITSACDILKMDIAQASTWIHALLANMVHPRKNQNLPTNLVEHPERNNGFRSLQLLAASLAVQNRKLAQTHQAFSLPTEGDNQDVNSLGTHAAFDLQESVNNLERLTAILFLASAQALELRGIGKASTKARQIYKIIRKHSKTVKECRVMYHELDDIVSLLRDEKI